MKHDEGFLNELRARKRVERNTELASRLECPRTTEDMITLLRGLKGLNVRERSNAQKKNLYAVKSYFDCLTNEKRAVIMKS